MEAHYPKIKSVRSLTDSQVVTLSGEGNFIIGLNGAESLKSCLEEELQESEIVVHLFMISVWKTSGTTLNPINRDLKCYVCGQLIQQESNLIPGSRIEVGDKVFEFLDGPAPQPRKSRCLPPTPGIHVGPSPPPKPSRDGQNPPPSQQVEDMANLGEDWCMLQMPDLEEELVSEALGSPDKMVQAAARFMSRQINLHTATRMTSRLFDAIFRLFQEVEAHHVNILENFLKTVANEIARRSEDEKEKSMPGPIIAVLTETLTCLLDPVEHAQTCLELLRSLSQVGSNMNLFLLHGSPAAILGSMTVLRDNAHVQHLCLDILARLATLQPPIHEKLPLRETAVELVNLALTQHPNDLHVAQAACRVLSNLSHTAFNLAYCILETGRHLDPNHQSQLDRVIALLDNMQTHTTSNVKTALAAFTSDLSVATEARRFLFLIGKLTQLHLKANAWLSHASVENDESEVEGILKKSRSFENLRHPDRRVFFEDWSNECLTSTDSESSVVSSSKAEIISHSAEPLSLSAQSQGACGVHTAVCAAQSMDKTPNSTPTPPPRCTSSRPRLPPRHQGPEVPLTVDYTPEDVVFLQQLTFAQIAFRVCSLAFHSDVTQALKLLDQPMQELVREAAISPEVQEFVGCQYREALTLMDLQPTMVIALVDAVRYKSVALEVLRQRVLEVLFCCDTGPCHDHCVLAANLLLAVAADPALASVLAHKDILEKCTPVLEKLTSASRNNSQVVELRKHLDGLSLEN